MYHIRRWKLRFEVILGNPARGIRPPTAAPAGFTGDKKEGITPSALYQSAKYEGSTNQRTLMIGSQVKAGAAPPNSLRFFFFSMGSADSSSDTVLGLAVVEAALGLFRVVDSNGSLAFGADFDRELAP